MDKKLFGDLIPRIKSMEEEANKRGHSLTLLCLYSNDFANQTPNEAAKSFNGPWRKLRATLHRQSIEIYGLRIIEPMESGDPRFLVILFSDPKHDDEIKTSAQKLFSASNFFLETLNTDIAQPKVEPILERRHARESYLERFQIWCKTYRIIPFIFFGQAAFLPKETAL